MGHRLTFFDFLKVLFSFPAGLLLGTSIALFIMFTSNPLEKKLERVIKTVRYVVETHLLTMFSIFFWPMVLILW